MIYDTMAADDTVVDPDFSLHKTSDASSDDESDDNIGDILDISYSRPPVDFSSIESTVIENDTVMQQTEPLTQQSDDDISVDNENIGTSRRKRRRTAEEMAMAKETKKVDLGKRHIVLVGCDERCNKKCKENFSVRDREEVNSKFWNLGWTDQKQFLAQTVTKQKPTRVRTGDHDSRKKGSYKFTLRQRSGEHIPVCKVFYLTTLGYNKNNDTVITKTFARIPDHEKSIIQPLKDRRRKAANPHAFDHNLIKKHVESYKPAIPHYMREHAPLRRYLPSDLSTKKMHADLKTSVRTDYSYSLYYAVFKTMNIGMAILGNEECEPCTKIELHQKSCKCTTVCIQPNYPEYLRHKRKYITARKHYQMDAESGNEIFSADLEKVIVLPRMEQFKSAIFTTRLVVFNETFAQLGKGNTNIAVIWNEGVSGRKDEDLCSAFYAFLKTRRDSEIVTLWLDNCAAQNKNWTLFTMLAFIVSCPDFGFTAIRLKFFEPGHTFMAADSVHAKIEREMKKMRRIYDFADFKECVKNAKCDAIELNHEDFRNWSSGLSYHTVKNTIPRPFLADMVVVEFRSGSRMLHYKTSHDDPSFFSVKFLKDKHVLGQAEAITEPRGIDPEKKGQIIAKLVPLMPENRKRFWQNIAENSRSKDLLTHF